MIPTFTRFIRAILRAACLVLLPSLACSAAFAAEPDARPLDARLVPAIPASAASDNPDTATAQADALRAARAEREEYESLVTSLEARQGIYGEQLSEAYVGLGRSLRKLQLHEEARAAFNKSLQSLRITYGLQDARQLAVLEELVAVNEALQDWDEVHAMHHLLFYVAKHSSNVDEEQRMKYLVQLGAWIRKAYRDELIADFNANASQLSGLYNNEIRRLQEHADYPEKSAHLAALYLALAETELMEATRKHELPISAFQTPGAGEQRTITTQQCVTGIDRTGRPMTYCMAPVETPNVNYYLSPNAQKSTEIRQHLSEVESKVMLAINTLRDSPAAPQRQDELLQDVQRLTQEYNDFVAVNPK
ncbi:MAG: hypothetical protein RLZZ227_829 [Pseudomonadota bacterium]|jgi:hypothetical protein